MQMTLQKYVYINKYPPIALQCCLFSRNSWLSAFLPIIDTRKDRQQHIHQQINPLRIAYLQVEKRHSYGNHLWKSHCGYVRPLVGVNKSSPLETLTFRKRGLRYSGIKSDLHFLPVLWNTRHDNWKNGVFFCNGT